MSRPVGKLYHPINQHSVDIFEGFSWPCFFLGCFWYLYKGMVIWAIIAFAVAFVTGGLAWLVFPFFGNKQHIDYLHKNGYLSEEQINKQAIKDFSDKNNFSHEAEDI